MRHSSFKRVLAFFLLGILLVSSAFAQETSQSAADPADSETATVTRNEDELIIDDYQAGYWFYESASQNLRVEIRRYIDEDLKLLWYEADVQTCPETPLQFMVANQELPGRTFYYAERIARNRKSVFAINDDQFGHRVSNHDKTGVIIRNGKILQTTTRRSGNLSWPNLDTAAFFADGSMRTFLSNDLKPQEYLDMGAHTVLSFGPYLIREGEINPMCINRFSDRENRMAIGMIEPYHYVSVYVEGRNKYSRGTGLLWIAERMKEMGCVEAFNLDGGATACMLFMGKKLQITNPKGIVRNQRSVSGLIGVGYSALVPEYNGVEKE